MMQEPYPDAILVCTGSGVESDASSDTYRGSPVAQQESACNSGATGDTGSIPGSGRSRRGRHGNPL